MKKALVEHVKKEKDDEFHTPRFAVEPLLKYIPKDKVIWCPFDTEESNYVKVFMENGYKVVYSHISMGQDFFFYEPENYDVIVSNPPFSVKTEILKRAYSLGKPFAFLLPITSLEGKKRGELFRKYGLQLIVFDRRIEFMSTTKTGVWFNTSYFCYKLLPRDLIFEQLEV
ncbi:DNA methyltransferase [Thermus phage phiYS40]|uniref:DNA methyltransferase n=1 Tax=Thermus phage phiYS40 TaxID=407392 RepID=UPI0000E68993|nr:DNA methyltransferase [Thermus phage phiYS40]ABJ91423.1 sugar-phospahte nucleotidyltransferase [Thermus phage phiYS40]BAK53547.1 sugar-phospahte nucleotidyltransferase [Thermus phage phiYS40]